MSPPGRPKGEHPLGGTARSAKGAESSLAEAIGLAIGAATGEPFSVRDATPVGGGCINRTMVVGDGARRHFVKVNDAHRLDMFEAEADGLAALAAAGTLRVPHVICTGQSGSDSFLVLEHLELGGPPSFARMGEQLAAVHRSTGPHFGWPRDNYIGATVQVNAQAHDWPTFFAERRLRPQLELARRNGHADAVIQHGLRLLERLPEFFTDFRPDPSLLHGDLWGGNASFLADGTPVIFDPATYRGDREADLAMTELFGGFPTAFYAAYRSTWALDAGYRTRRDLYNLYHVLNHLNLFGGAYLRQAERLIDKLIAEISGV